MGEKAKQRLSLNVTFYLSARGYSVFARIISAVKHIHICEVEKTL
jgi:hypothetical protein